MSATPEDLQWLDAVSVILVDTRQAGNVGAAARAMKNMGLSKMRLVRPRQPVNDECRKMAGSALELVEQAPVFESLADALADQHLAFATTSVRGRSLRSRVLSPREAAPQVLQAVSAGHSTALVFGSERSGLDEDQLALCQRIVSVPASPAHPTLNLAQAVLILAYELFLTLPSGAEPELTLASQKETEAMFSQMQRVLVDVGFLHSSNPAHIMRDIRRFLGTADLTPRDVQILRGIFRQVEWFVTEGRHLPAEKVRKR